MIRQSQGLTRVGLPVRLWMLVCVGLAGCPAKPQGPPTVPVSGKVTMKQTGVDGALVVFYPADGSDAAKPVQAMTGADGTFTVKTHVEGSTYKDGMQPGNYIITVSKTEPQPPGVMLPPKELLPAKYIAPHTSPFRENVPEAGRTFDLEIK